MPRRYSMSNRRSQTEATRQRAIEAFRALVRERDWRDISMKDVAERADIALRTLYCHFPNRAALIAAVVASWNESLLAAEPPSSGTLVERIRHVVRSHFHAYEIWGEQMLAAYCAALQSAERPPLLEEGQRQHRALVARELSPLLGEAADCPARVAVLAALTSSHFWRVLTDHHGLSNDEAVEAVVDLIKRAYAPGVDREDG